MIAYMALLVVAAAAFGLAKQFRLPVIPLLLVLGTGASFAGLRPPEKMVEGTVVLGLTFLVFACGIELNPFRFRPQRKRVPWVALAQFAVVGMAGIGVARLLGMDAIAALYVGFALSASSTLVVVRQLKMSGQMFEPFGRLVVGVLLVQDLAIILVIVILGHIGGGASAVGLAMLWTAGLGAMAVGCQKWFMPWLILGLKLDEEATLLAVLAVLFIFVGVATTAGLPMPAGAFFAGFALSACPINGVVRGQLSSLNDFSLSLFFVMVGSLVALPSAAMMGQVVIFVVLVLLLTVPLVTLVAEITGANSRSAIESGLLLSQTSEFSIVLALVGTHYGHLSPELFSVIVLTTIITMVLTPFVATDKTTWWLMHLHPLRQREKSERKWSGHILSIGFGSGGIWIIKPLLQQGYDVLVVDDDPIVIDALRKAEIPCMRGDGSDPLVLERAGAREARLLIGTVRRPADTEKILRHLAGRVPVLLRVFEDKDARRIEELGGRAILTSEAAANAFLKWFESLEKSPGSARQG